MRHAIAGTTIAATLLLAASSTNADIVRGDDPPEITDIYTNLDDWLADAPEVITIDFTGFADGTQINTQFADLGVNFTLGFYTVFDAAGFTDLWGLDGNSSTIVMEFDQPFNVIGVMFPGALRYELYLDDEFVGWTETQGGGGSGFFAGLLTDIMFDEVRVVRDSGEVFIDNLYFSFLEVPAPAAALPLLALAGLTGRTRRRRT